MLKSSFRLNVLSESGGQLLYLMGRDILSRPYPFFFSDDEIQQTAEDKPMETKTITSEQALQELTEHIQGLIRHMQDDLFSLAAVYGHVFNCHVSIEFDKGQEEFKDVLLRCEPKPKTKFKKETSETEPQI